MRRLLVLLGLATGAAYLLKRRSAGDAVADLQPFAPPAPTAPVPPAPRAEPPAEPDPPAAPRQVDEPAAAPVPLSDAAPYGPGSAAPTADGSAPDGFTIKGNAQSGLYHTDSSPYYKRTKAEVWFATAEAAQAAGFKAWEPKRKS